MDAMTQNPGQTAGTPQQTSGMDRFFGWLRALDVRRDTEDKWLAGVCSGIANRLGVDPLVIRAALVVLILLGGVGVTLYLIAWAFIPNDKEEIVAERGLRDGDFWGIAILVLIALSLIGGSGFIDGDGWGLWWLWWLVIPVGLVVWLVTRNRNQDEATRAQVATWGQQAGTQAGGVGREHRPEGRRLRPRWRDGHPLVLRSPLRWPRARSGRRRSRRSRGLRAGTGPAATAPASSAPPSPQRRLPRRRHRLRSGHGCLRPDGLGSRRARVVR